MPGLRSITKLGADSLRGIKPSTPGKPPTFEWVDPRTLFVEEAYQRDVRENGIKLIRRIYAGFDWSRLKPPVCVRAAELDGVLVCIDGQHTAIAAASHPGIDLIPVMIVEGIDVASRAAAFVGHNADRLALTRQAVFLAEVAAGDPIAVEALRACQAAGAEVSMKPINTVGRYKPGLTVAVSTIKTVLKRHGPEMLTAVMKVLVAAERGPIKADEITATAMILQAPDVDPARLTAVVASKTAEAWYAIATVDAASTAGSRHNRHIPAALASAWCRELVIRLQPVAVKPTPPAVKPQKPAGRPKLPTVSIPAPEAPTQPAALPVAPRPVPKPIPPPPPRPAPPPAPPRPAAPPEAAIEANGVLIDPETQELTHRGRTVRIGRDDDIRALTLLARVKPALIPMSNLADKAFGRGVMDSTDRLRALVENLNPVLRHASLEIRTVPKIGHTLADLEA